MASRSKEIAQPFTKQQKYHKLTATNDQTFLSDFDQIISIEHHMLKLQDKLQNTVKLSNILNATQYVVGRCINMKMKKYLLKRNCVYALENNSQTSWEFLMCQFRSSEKKSQEEIRCGRDLSGKLPVRDNGQGARGSCESWRTTVQVRPQGGQRMEQRSGRKNLRLRCNFKKISAEPMGSFIQN